MTSRRQKKYRNQDFAKYYDGATIFWLVFSLFYTISIFGSNELGILVCSFIMGCVGYQIGLRRNKNPVRWFCFGFLFNILIFLIILIDNCNEKEKRYRKKSQVFNNSKETLRERKLLQANENIIFQQAATYKGGIPGYPKVSEDYGLALILDTSFIFYDQQIQFKLFFSEIIEAKLDFFQMDSVRGFLAFGAEGRQLQETKNTIDICYIDNKNVERNAKFQIHGALTISGEEVKAREFLNHLLEFKEHFIVKTKNNPHTIDSIQQLDNLSKLEKLKHLKDKGVISDAEFEIKKKQILDEI